MPQLDNKKIHLINWDTVCRPKSMGGMGVIDLKSLNHSLLAKWMWRWLSPHDTLWKQINIISHSQPRQWSNPHAYPF